MRWGKRERPRPQTEDEALEGVSVYFYPSSEDSPRCQGTLHLGRLQFTDRSLSYQDRRHRELAALRMISEGVSEQARRLRAELTSLAIAPPRNAGPVDLGTLNGLHNLESLAVISESPVVGVEQLGNLPVLRRLLLSRAGDLQGIGRASQLEELELRSCGVRDLRALAPLSRLRRLTLDDSVLQSLSGIEDLPLEALELWYAASVFDVLRRRVRDFTALRDLPSSATVTLRGEPIPARERAALATCNLARVQLAWDLDRDQLAMLEGDSLATSVELETTAVPESTSVRPTMLSALRTRTLDAPAQRLLRRSPRLRRLELKILPTEDLAILADHPSLEEISFARAPNLRTLDCVPRLTWVGGKRLVTDIGGHLYSGRLRWADPPPRPKILQLRAAPLTSIRQIGNLRGVEHLGLRECLQLRSLTGIESMQGLQTIDLRGIDSAIDLSALAGCETLRAIILTHQGPQPELFPSEVRHLIVRDHLKGVVARLYAGGVLSNA